MVEGVQQGPVLVETFFMVQEQSPSATLDFSAHAKTGTDHKINKLYLSREWRGQSDIFDIHAVHANRALLPSKP